MNKVLIISKDEIFVRETHKTLQLCAIGIVDSAVKESQVLFGELADRYNIIIIDKQFCGNGRSTATFVRRIRQEFFDPIIGVELMAGDGELYSLQVAGCNFNIRFGNLDSFKAPDAICDMVVNIASELANPYQSLSVSIKS